MARRSRSERTRRNRDGVGKEPSRRKLAFEPLEDRRLLAVAVVDTTLDVVDLNDGLTSLREAIFAANTVAGADTIEFAPALTAGGPATILLEHGELEITDALTINGPGADLFTIDAQQQSRIFNITATSGDFAIVGLTLTHGRTTGSNPFDSDTMYNGGAIRSLSVGLLSLEGITVSSSSTIGNGASGGGIFAVGPISLSNCTVTVNSTSGNNAPGGGISTRSSFEARDTTISANSTTGGGTIGNGASGGGIFAVGPLSLSNCTVTANSTSGKNAHGGGIYSTGNFSASASAISANAIPGDGSSGAGVFVEGTSTITNSHLNENVVNGTGYGAAIASMGMSILVDTDISGNALTADLGSAVYAKVGADVTDTRIVDNLSGGISTDPNFHWVINLVRSEVSGHSKPAGPFGGGGVSTQGTVYLQQSIVTGNHIDGSGMKGGGVYARYAFAAVDSVIADNSTTGVQAAGGGIYAFGFASLSNTRVENNSTNGPFSPGGAVWANKLAADAGSVISGNRATRSSGGAIYAQEATLDGVTLSDNHTYGNQASGGAVFADEVTISNSTVEGNSTSGDESRGGAIYAGRTLTGKLTITNSSVSGNSTLGHTSAGGGIFGRGKILLTAVAVSENKTCGAASPGGAAFLTISSFDSPNGIISSCLFEDNGTVGNNSDGGGVYTDTGGLRIESSTIAGNYTLGDDSDGGGVRGAGVEFLNSTVSDNSTMGDRSKGGGIFARAGMSLSESTVSGNRTDGTASHGGGIVTGSFSSIFSTIVDNEAVGDTSYAGGIWAKSTIAGGPMIVGTILARNNAAGGSPDIKAPSLFRSAKYSLIGDKSGTDLIESPFGSPDANGNLIGGPVNGMIDPLLGPLAYNGGPVFLDGTKMLTHALLPGSPAIDAGDPAAMAGVDDVPEFDQRGMPFVRVANGDDVPEARIDIGAYERQPGETYQLVVDTLVDEDDGDYSSGDFSLREAIAIANPGSDTIEFAPALTAGGPATILLTQGELAITDALTINGPGADVLTIDAKQQSRLLNIDAPNVVLESFDVFISDLTLTHGRTTGNNPISLDTTFNGGAIRSVSSGTLTIDRSIIRDSSTIGIQASAGGIFAVGNVVLNASVVSGNHTLKTGGGLLTYGSVVLTRSVITGNNAASSAGVRSLADVTLMESAVTKNSSTFLVGGILSSGKATIVQSTVSNNNGGGIRSGGQTLISQSTVSGNTLFGDFSYGGGVHTDGPLTLTNSSVIGNHADKSRGGIWSGRRTDISDSIVAGNTTEGFSPDLAVFGNNVIVSHSLIGDSSASGLIEAPLGSPDANANLIGGPVYGVIDPKLGPLAYNGGQIFLDGSRMLTHALLPSSPAIDLDGPYISDPTSLYRFDEGSGSTAIDSINDVDGTYDGDVTLGQPSAYPSLGSAAQLDGVDDYVVIPQTVSDDFSLSLWMKTTQPAGEWALIGGDVPGSSKDLSVLIVNGHIIFQVGGGTVPPSGNAISDGIWHHVAVSRESTTGNTLVYVDGIRTGPAFWPGATGPMSAASELHVGELLSGLSHYEGLIDELGIYDRVLTPTEVYQLATPTDPAFDQRGMPWSRVVGGRIDIGAVESQANPLAGDYNFDGIVNAADSSVWRNTVGSKNDLRADGSGEEFGVPDGVVDELDYAFWKASFGNVLEAGGGASSLSTAGQGSSGTREALAEPVAPGPSQLAGELRLAAPIVVDSAKRSSPADETIVNGKATTSDLRSDGALVAWLAARTTPKSRDDGAIASATHDQNAEEGEFCTALDRVFQLLGDE